MLEKKDIKEPWEPERGLDDPVLMYVLSFLYDDTCISLPIFQGRKLLALCKELNIQPIVYEKLKSSSDDSLKDKPWFRALRVESLKIAGASSYRQQTIERVVGTLHQAGIKPILLKGPALGNTVYPRMHWRTSSDIDLLIDPKEWEVANESLIKLGYQSSPCLNWGYLSFEKSYTPTNYYPESPLIELHLRLNNRPLLCVFSYQELVENAVQTTIGNQVVWIPERIDHFIYLCVHRVGHFPQDRRFAWLLDLFYLSRSFSESDWQKVVDLALKKEVATILKICLDDLYLVFKISAPDAALAVLEKRVASGNEASVRYVRQRYSKAQDLLNRWLEIPSFRAKFAYLWRWVIPPKSYMSASFKSEHVLLQHVERFMKGIRKYFGVG